ncbi:hypothetical protein I4U23_030726 [Adineta vaga]|nr:hypothetical protein I4U23_030726 [Adineta vaga]
MYGLAIVHCGPRRGSEKHGPGDGNRGPPGFGPRPHGPKNQWETKVCANASIAEAFLEQTRQLITDLQANGTYDKVLEKRQNEINYINNANNTGVLSSNCTQFFTGLNAARTLDRQAQEQEWSIQRTAGRLFFQIIQSLVGGKAQDSSEGDA